MSQAAASGDDSIVVKVEDCVSPSRRVIELRFQLAEEISRLGNRISRELGKKIDEFLLIDSNGELLSKLIPTTLFGAKRSSFNEVVKAIPPTQSVTVRTYRGGEKVQLYTDQPIEAIYELVSERIAADFGPQFIAGQGKDLRIRTENLRITYNGSWRIGTTPFYKIWRETDYRADVELYIRPIIYVYLYSLLTNPPQLYRGRVPADISVFFLIRALIEEATNMDFKIIPIDNPKLAFDDDDDLKRKLIELNLNEQTLKGIIVPKVEFNEEHFFAYPY